MQKRMEMRTRVMKSNKAVKGERSKEANLGGLLSDPGSLLLAASTLLFGSLGLL